MAASYETLELQRRGPVLSVWLNRPERLNAITETMLREIGDLYRSLETDFETRVVVLGGRGRAFSAGMDLRAGPSPDSPAKGPRERRWQSGLGRRACRAIEDAEVVTVARLHGHVVGGGSCFATSCDFRIAAEGTLFRLPEVELGIPLSWAAVPRLQQEIGAARTREYLLLCRDVPAAKAERWGLVHEVVVPEDLDTAVARWVDEILDKPELAVHMTKTQLRGYARRTSLGDATETDADMISVAARVGAAQERFRPKGED